MKNNSSSILWFGLVVFCVLELCWLLQDVAAQTADSVCAKVKIEIQQELTFERQAFDAHMQINNGLTTISLENISIDVLFADEDGVPVKASSDSTESDAFFFIRVDSMTGTDDVSGSGTLSPASKADIHWLIIPAPASVENAPTGALYYVGAKLSYTINGVEETTVVTPDYIHVRPLPDLTLDYFLPDEVYGDDPFTDAAEPSIPFSLGVKISNNGHGVATNVKIDSAQPKIVENKLGLAVDFKIIGSEVNGVSAPETLLIEFGDIQPASAATGRWFMTSSLSGRFVDFEASYTHADELGGELTSLLSGVNTHTLVQDVMVDAPGRDAYKDFLAKDDDRYSVYESDGGATDVINQSSGSKLTLVQQDGGEAVYRLETPVTGGFFYCRLDDLQKGTKVLYEVLRSDGKVIKPENSWLSKKRVEAEWTYSVNLFDYNGPGNYTLRFLDASLVPVPPVVEEQEDPVTKEGEEVVLVVNVADPNNLEAGLRMHRGAIEDFTCPQSSGTDNGIRITVKRLPVGAEFVDCGNGRAILRWTPQDGQAGKYPFAFTVTNDQGSTVIRYHLVVTDKDNIPTAHFVADIVTGYAPQLIHFTDQSLSQDGIKHYYWEFGDGAISTEQNPSHWYQDEGVYSVSLVVSEIDGDMHQYQRSNYISIAEIPDLPTDPAQAFTPGALNGVWSILLQTSETKREINGAFKMEQDPLLEKDEKHVEE